MLTLAFSQLVFSVALKWRDLTGGSDGLAILKKPGFLVWDLSNSLPMYFMALTFFMLCYWGLRRLINAPLGHVFIGIRENEPRMLAIGYAHIRLQTPILHHRWSIGWTAAGSTPSSTVSSRRMQYTGPPRATF